MLSKKDFDIAYFVQRIQICVCGACIYALWLLYMRMEAYREHRGFNAVGETPFALTYDTLAVFNQKFLDSFS